jgi:hypothetical protein
MKNETFIYTICYYNGVLSENAKNGCETMNKNQIETMKELEGSEVFYEDLGAVGIKVEGTDVFVIDCGRKIKSSYKKVMTAYLMTEYGTTDMSEIMSMEGF